MKRAIVLMLSASLLLPSVSNATLIVRTGPSLTEIQAGLDACLAGDEINCKYERYAGVVRKTKGGSLIIPPSEYILAGELKEGTVLPKISDRRALLKALKDKEVEVVAFKASDSPILLASTEPGKFLQQYAVIVPKHIVELAEQNGIAAHEMLLHIQTNLVNGALSAEEIVTEHTALVLSIAGNVVVIDQEQIDEKLAQLEELQRLYEDESLQSEALAAVIANLQETIDGLTGDLLLQALVADGLRKQIEAIVNNGAAEIRTALEGVTEARERTNVIVGLAAAGNTVAQLALDRAAEAIIPSIGDTAETNARDAARAADVPTRSYQNLDLLVIEITLEASNLAVTAKDRDYLNAAHALIISQGTALTSQQLTDLANNLTPAAYDVFRDIEDVFFKDTVADVLQDFIEEIFETGYEAGYLQGYEEGYESGYSDGYRDGYQDGFVDGVNSVTDTLNGD